MAETIACLGQGKVLLVQSDGTSEPLRSPFLEQLSEAERAGARVVSVSGGRRQGELYYAVQTATGSTVLAQRPSTGEELRLFHGRGMRLTDIDFSFADTALACTIEGERGTSAIGLLADDGLGMHTVTEGDVLDRAPRWVPGGVREIVYASTGIARTRAGERAALSPSALHRLRFADSSVEVLVSDAKYDYFAPRQRSDGSLYALRRAYAGKAPESRFTRLMNRLRSTASVIEPSASSDLVHITPKSTRVLLEGVHVFDVLESGDLVCATDSGLVRLLQSGSGAPANATPMAELPFAQHATAAIDALVAYQTDGP